MTRPSRSVPSTCRSSVNNNNEYHHVRHHGHCRSRLLSRSPLLMAIVCSSVLVGAAAQAQQDGGGEALLFDLFDSNHDGSVTRSEYTAGFNRLRHALSGNGDAGGGGEAVNRAAGAGGTGGGGAEGRVVSSAEAAAAAAAGAGGGMVKGQEAAEGEGEEGIPKSFLQKFRRRPQPSGKSDSKKPNFWSAFTSSFSMILATEIGDKTFFIAAVLSMRNDRKAVFAGAILALIIMTVLSTAMGVILPSILPRQFTHIIGGLLFLYFGIRLIIDSRSMAANKVSDELEEVEDKLLRTGRKKEKEEEEEDGIDVESNGAAGVGGGNNKEVLRKSESSMSNASSYHGSPQKVFVQALTLTFLAEWGDRSQIATIALAAAKDPYGVTVGGCLGHCICTGMAVIGGRMLAARISEKTVSLWGGVVFNIFGVHSIFFEA